MDHDTNAARWAELSARPLLNPIPDRCRNCPACAFSTEGVRPCPAHLLMSADEARQFRAEESRTARELSRTRAGELRAIDRDELEAHGIVRIMGKMSKDELISEIMRYRFPPAEVTEAIHVLHHQPGQVWDGCPICTAPVDCLAEKLAERVIAQVKA